MSSGTETTPRPIADTATLYYEGSPEMFRACAAEFILPKQDLDRLCDDVIEAIRTYEELEGAPAPDPMAVIIKNNSDVALWEELDTYKEAGTVARRLKKIGEGIMNIFGYLGAARLGYPYEGDPGMDD